MTEKVRFARLCSLCSTLAVLLSSTALLSGCGQSGDLFLPGSDADPAAVEAVPAEDNDEEGTDEE